MCSIPLIRNAHDHVKCLASTQVDCHEVPDKVLLEAAGSLMGMNHAQPAHRCSGHGMVHGQQVAEADHREPALGHTG